MLFPLFPWILDLVYRDKEVSVFGKADQWQLFLPAPTFVIKSQSDLVPSMILFYHH